MVTMHGPITTIATLCVAYAESHAYIIGCSALVYINGIPATVNIMFSHATPSTGKPTV